MSTQIKSMQDAVKRGLAKLTYALRPKEAPQYAEDLVSFVKEEFKRRREERRPYELQWRLNMAFIEGQQYMEINSQSMDIEETLEMASWEHREVFNHIAPIVETRMAKLGKMQPKLSVRPASSELGDLSKAKIAKKLLDNFEQTKFTQSQRQEFLSWLEACGTVFLKNSWDGGLGRLVGEIGVDAEDDTPRFGEDRTERPKEDDLMSAGQMISEELEEGAQDEPPPVEVEGDSRGARATTQVAMYEGDVRIDVLSPFEVYPDSPIQPDLDRCNSIIHARAYPISVIQEAWGRQVDPEDDLDSWGLAKNQVASGGLGYGVGGFHTKTVSLKNHALVIEYWERPSAAYPHGRFIAVCNNKCLYSGDLPYQVGEDGDYGLPFVRTVAIVRPGNFYGSCVTERLIPIQRRFNAWHNRKAEYNARVAIGQMWLTEGSVDNPSKFEEDAGAPGAVFWIKRGHQGPTYMQFPSLPSSFEQEGQFLLNQFTMISGVSETTRMSEAPPGVKSGVALDLVIEQDNTRLSHTVENIEGAHIQEGKQVLRMYKQFAVNQRILRTTGEDNSADIVYWDSSDITTDDVIVETSALLADTPAQRRQMVLQLLQFGFYNDPDTGRITREGRAKIAEQLKFGNWEQALEVDELHIKRAEKENALMSQGQFVMPKQYDNEELHIGTHVSYMLTDEFEHSNMESQGQLEMFMNQHMQYHMMILQAKQMALMPQNIGQAQGEVQIEAQEEGEVRNV